jgi:hypothetical protein
VVLPFTVNLWAAAPAPTHSHFLIFVQRPTNGGYPQLTNLASLLEHWDQDEDFYGTITETLLHFNYSDPHELEMARKFRDAELPFKLTNVPELAVANLKWTDEYLSQEFVRGKKRGRTNSTAHLLGFGQEAIDNFMAFYIPAQWNVNTLGLPPVRDNDWTFAKWAAHAQYADASRLSADQPHYYWQAGVTAGERNLPKKDWNFISRDLPSFASTTAVNFLHFFPVDQSGIQCRFGERGVVAATHYDTGRNMVGMITGAKRYILSPPKACGNLGIFNERSSPLYRHSLLNFGHLKYLNSSSSSHSGDEAHHSMSLEERAWLERAAQADAVETVLKAGEVLYIPSHWFHYVISLQKSAQCNVRSGIDRIGSREFGGEVDIMKCLF